MYQNYTNPVYVMSSYIKCRCSDFPEGKLIQLLADVKVYVHFFSKTLLYDYNKPTIFSDLNNSQ